MDDRPPLAPPALLEQLERARALGFLGPGPVERHIDHAQGFLHTVAQVTGTIGDLGSGGGVPGLILGVERPDLRLVFIEASAVRCRFLEAACGALHLDAEVAEGRAEVVGRGPWRHRLDAVVARSFGSPATTAECGAPLLVEGGLLVVSEPPEPAADRWPPAGLLELGLEPLAVAPSAPGGRVQVLRQARPCPDRFPRRDGVPAQRPLF